MQCKEVLRSTSTSKVKICHNKQTKKLSCEENGMEWNGMREEKRRRMSCNLIKRPHTHTHTHTYTQVCNQKVLTHSLVV